MQATTTGSLRTDVYPTQTKAAVLRAPRQPLSIESLEVPRLKSGQVLVEIAYSGICGSQRLEVNGERGEDPHLPHTLGHEGSGVVLAIGEGVEKVQPGDHVVLTWIKGDGANVASTHYLNSGEVVNSGAISTFLENAVISENRVVPVPFDLSLKTVALLGCAALTGIGAVSKTAKVEPGSTVGIFGVGGVGLSAVVGASLAHAETIVAIDFQERRLERAMCAGATATINPRNASTVDSIAELTSGIGLDYAIECSGSKEATETAFSSVHTNGGCLVIAGNLRHGEKIEIDPFDLIRGKQIIGTWGGGSKPDDDIPDLCQLLRSGELTLDCLLGPEYPLERVSKAFNDIENGVPGRPTLCINRS